MIIDFHTHILPGIDDGSPNLAVSMDMLREMLRQQVGCVVATPHCNVYRTSVDDFLRRRERAQHALLEAAHSEHMDIRLIAGAEVSFFPGISMLHGIEQLCIQGTNLCLLEMPFRTWSRQDIQEVNSLIQQGIVPVIAHLERYQQGKEALDMLLALPVYAQMNAEYLLKWSTRRQALRWIKADMVQLLGSDCHNTASRPPNLQAGRNVLREKLGQAFLHQMDLFGQKLLGVYEDGEL
ncbi:MAG: capsular polysaccharide biosynthesis protein [Eubacteriales bacterium]|nr:capsular polysaccharide biosynthesis protein [Eubacteriales bacterium]